VVEVEFSEFQKLDIRVGKVISAERVAGATKLLRFTVDFGEFKRQSVAGLGHIYDPEHFIGKQYVFVVNLKPRKIRGRRQGRRRRREGRRQLRERRERRKRREGRGPRGRGEGRGLRGLSQKLHLRPRLRKKLK